MAVLLTEIIRELDVLLQPRRFRDYCPNGLQVPGRPQISTIATGVSASVELFELAQAEKADLILVHHGIFWGSSPQPIDAAVKRRLRLLFDDDVALAAYHLPLDAHAEIGNNVLIAKALGFAELRPFALHDQEPIGCMARVAGEPIPAAVLMQRIRALTAREPLVFDSGPPLIRSLGVVSGAGAGYLPDAIAEGADAFLTGEPAERVMSEAREAGVHFIAAGHYATETFGIRRLGERLSERFDVRHVFLDVPNPI